MHSNLESRLLNLESKKDKKRIFVIYYKRGETPEEAVEKSGYDGPVIARTNRRRVPYTQLPKAHRCAVKQFSRHRRKDHSGRHLR